MESKPDARDIRFLVTDQSGEFVLTRFAAEGVIDLPGGTTTEWSDDAAPFVAGARALLGDDVPILRIIPLDPDHDNALEWLAELEPTERSRRGHRWIPRAEIDPAAVTPPAARAPLERWLHELANGRSRLRPPWSRPGWFATTSAWVVDRLREAGLEPEAPVLHQSWGISAILRVETSGGRFYAKRAAEAIRAEGSLTAMLAGAAPELVPVVEAVDDATGVFLMRDLDGTPLGDDPGQGWTAGLVALAAVQHACIDRLEELAAAGGRDRGPAAVAAFVARLAPGDPAIAGLTTDERQRFRDAIPRIIGACRRLDELAPLRSVVHCDFHSGNVVLTDGGARVFDWSDASIGHPFVDLATYLIGTDDTAARRRLRDAYLDTWSGEGDRDRLIEAADLALVVGAFLEVESYQIMHATFDVDDLWDLEDAAAGWLRQGLAYLDQGIDAPSVH
jgi:hypothetical protein